MRLNIRLFGVSATPAAMADLIKILPKNFICETTFNKRSKVGRCLGYVFVQEDETCININEVLIAQGHSLDII
jgi:endonuclease YncB( thermonuclease family)